MQAFVLVLCAKSTCQPYLPGQEVLHHTLRYLFVFSEFGFQGGYFGAHVGKNGSGVPGSWNIYSTLGCHSLL